MGTARDIALIFLSLEALVAALIPLALLGALIYGMFYVNRWTAVYLRKGQVYVQQAHDWVNRTTDAIAAPLIKAHAAAAAVATMFHTLRRMLGRDA